MGEWKQSALVNSPILYPSEGFCYHLPGSIMKVGLVYDAVYLEHDTGGHPENRQRLENVIALLEETGPRKRLVSLAPRAATEEELLLAHTAEHI